MMTAREILLDSLPEWATGVTLGVSSFMTDFVRPDEYHIQARIHGELPTDEALYGEALEGVWDVLLNMKTSHFYDLAGWNDFMAMFGVEQYSLLVRGSTLRTITINK